MKDAETVTLTYSTFNHLELKMTTINEQREAKIPEGI
jgi:hypothetical protein